ncbi:hypothetical protein [Desulfoscipio geothermicus]|uniref:Uncharacterized protein n=1 Tax=Desulfoscipio geothermicus DSM 3669 TaxID=1121426 RepID=A0A1I6E5W3_9FIRM|nr:hypothetical protein [Desulfoscipio geothermicus]SFR12898.1 hypothetical protein SAMN05660706_12631 [Desulfoscipio geothermicus DSM 3669]
MQFANVLAFPSAEDQHVIQTAVETFLYTQTGKTREVMLKTIRAVLDRYGITKFGFADYMVYATREPRWSIIKAKHIIQGDNCPGCGDRIYNFKSAIRILSIEEHLRRHYVSYGCRCGRVFGKWEPAI